jgi:hypothetical protein
MDIDVFPRAELPLVLRTLRSALNPGAALEPRERAFIDTFARIVGHRPTPAELAAVDAADVHLEAPHARKRLLQLAALAVLLSRPVRAESVAYLHALARRLGTHDPVLPAIDALRRGRPLRVRVLTMRRMMRVMLKEAYLAEGAAGIARMFAALVFKLPVNTDKVWNYKRLGLLPEGTLGREYWKHMTTVGFSFPGEPAGIADTVAYHDIGHVLAEHAATPEGEIQQGSFQGGNRREDGFFFVQFVVLHFHQGVPITPNAPTAVDHFDPEKVLWAIQRGARCTVDMTHQWNYWPLLALPIDEARRRCGLLPRRIDAAFPGWAGAPG